MKSIFLHQAHYGKSVGQYVIIMILDIFMRYLSLWHIDFSCLFLTECVFQQTCSSQAEERVCSAATAGPFVQFNGWERMTLGLVKSLRSKAVRPWVVISKAFKIELAVGNVLYPFFAKCFSLWSNPHTFKASQQLEEELEALFIFHFFHH